MSCIKETARDGRHAKERMEYLWLLLVPNVVLSHGAAHWASTHQPSAAPHLCLVAGELQAVHWRFQVGWGGELIGPAGGACCRLASSPTRRCCPDTIQ